MGETSEERRRLLCRCLGVASFRIHEAVRSRGLTLVDEVTKVTGAGGGCTTCHPEIEEIIAEVRGEPIDSAIRLENRLICESETRVRIEGCVESLIGPRLAKRGVSIDAIEIHGLRVRVRLSGEVHEEARRFVDEKLRKYICADLEVETLG